MGSVLHRRGYCVPPLHVDCSPRKQGENMRYCENCGESLQHHGGHGYWCCGNEGCDHDAHYYNTKGELTRVTKVVILGENNGKQHIR